MTNIKDLKKSFEYYLNNKKSLMEKYYGKFIVIKDEKVLDAYDSEKEAIDESIKAGLELGDFIVQVVLENDGTKANFVSNVYV